VSQQRARDHAYREYEPPGGVAAGLLLLCSGAAGRGLTLPTDSMSPRRWSRPYPLCAGEVPDRRHGGGRAVNASIPTTLPRPGAGHGRRESFETRAATAHPRGARRHRTAWVRRPATARAGTIAVVRTSCAGASFGDSTVSLRASTQALTIASSHSDSPSRVGETRESGQVVRVAGAARLHGEPSLRSCMSRWRGRGGPSLSRRSFAGIDRRGWS
jgi:hypothetical protein